MILTHPPPGDMLKCIFDVTFRRCMFIAGVVVFRSGVHRFSEVEFTENAK